MTGRLAVSLFVLLYSATGDLWANQATEFCLVGKLDLGVRYQGVKPDPEELYPTTWCVTTENNSNRVFYSAEGYSNADIAGGWAVAYLPPNTVRIVDRDAGQDIEFSGTDNLNEALRLRRADPRRLFEEFSSSPDLHEDVQIEVREGRVVNVQTSTVLPLRGSVGVEWIWNWKDVDEPLLRLVVDDELLFVASGRWRDVPDNEANALWETTPGADVVNVPGIHWPARVDMRLTRKADGVYIVEGVRTGFQHMVVDTTDGLVVVDAPAGWVEFHHIPPSDLVPGIGINGLSGNLVGFLSENFPDRPIRAVALTHFHDDHSGGARAFATVGANIYASVQSAGFIQGALNRSSTPDDRLNNVAIEVSPVVDSVVIGSSPKRVKLVSIGAGPHSYDTLGVWAMDKGIFFVSDVHVPRSDSDSPVENRAETECWFALWAVHNLPSDVQVLNSHSDTATPVSRLAKYVESDICGGQ